MKRTGFGLLVVSVAGFIASGVTSAVADPVGSVFTFQGQLKQTGMPYDGTADIAARLFDAAGGGSQVGPTLALPGVTVTNGLVALQLGFGPDIFEGSERWVELEVNGVVLSPRHPVTPTPYALHALNAPFSVKGSTIYYTGGKLGIGATDPWGQVSVDGGQVGFFSNECETGFWADTALPHGIGMKVSSTGNEGCGAFCEALGPNSTGVFGHGKLYGVRGQATDPNGFGGYFTGERHFFEGKVGIDTVDPWGQVSVEGGQVGFFADECETGFWVETSAGHGIGLKVTSRGDEGYGALCEALGANSTGVFGHGRLYGVRGQASAAGGFGGYFTGDRHFFEGDLGIGAETPLAALHVADVGKWGWGVANGWGDFTLSNGIVGFSIGVATEGGGTGDVRLWTTGGTERLILGNPTDGNIMSINDGGVAIGMLNPQHPLHMAGGAYCDGASWVNASSRELKEDFRAADARQILEGVASLEIARWSYKAEANVPHLGPVAEDFSAAFDVGRSDGSISTIDADGVALAAIQGLYQLVREKNDEITDLKQRLAELEKSMEQLGSRGAGGAK